MLRQAVLEENPTEKKTDQHVETKHGRVVKEKRSVFARAKEVADG